ncbi:MAG TPA: HK97 gp10 family phage protein [Actinophytocola sp.]|nr:HK97 gp10 family phage protein [Actinophytocola sp.]
MQDFEKTLAEAIKAMADAAGDGVEEACEDLLSDSRDEVPYDQGDLSRSGKVTVQRTGDGAEGSVSYDTPYAVIQHERGDFAHDTGKSRYLGDPLRASAQKYLEHIADAARKALE